MAPELLVLRDSVSDETERENKHGGRHYYHCGGSLTTVGENGEQRIHAIVCLMT